MSRAGTRMKVVHALLLLSAGLLALPSGATAQTYTTGSKAVAIFSGIAHSSCALLVSKRPPWG